MASTPELRSGSWSVYWVMGGRGGKKQRTTWETEAEAIQAKKLAEAHRHNITRDEVYNQILGIEEEGESTPTLREWVKVWLETKTRITPGTASTYRRQFDSEILPAMGDKRLREIDGTEVARFINRLRSCDCVDGKRGPRCSRRRGDGHGLTDATTTRYFSALHACLQYAVKERKIDDNPASAKRTDWVRDSVAHDDAGDEEGHVYLTPHEYGLILAAAAPDARPFIEFLMGAGARFSEAAAMAVGAVKLDDEPPTVSIHRAWKSGRAEGSTTRWYLGATKGRSRRTIEIDDDLAEMLKPLVEGQPAKGFLFRPPKGDHIVYRNWFERRWVPAVTAAMRCELHPPAPRGRQVAAGELAGPLCGDNGGVRDDGGRCGAKVLDGWDRCRTHVGPATDAVSACDCTTRLRKRATPHDLRHTHAAWLFSDGVPPLEISRRLGHKQLSTTSEIYGGLMPDTQRASVAAIAAAKKKAKRPAADA